MATIDMHEAKTQLSDLVARAEAGEEIVIARDNRPAVRLVPVRLETKPAVPAPSGFAEDDQAEIDARELRAAVEAGQSYTIMRDGEAIATVVPVLAKKKRVPGRLAHLRGNLPPDLFDQPLERHELEAWEGKHSGDEDR